MGYIVIDDDDFKTKNKLSLMIYGVEYEKLKFKSDNVYDLRSSIIDFHKLNVKTINKN